MTVPTWTGVVLGLFIAPVRGAPTRSCQEVDVVAGVGLAGDRYALGQGHFSAGAGGDTAITLIEQEAIDAVRLDYGIDLDPGVFRRNVVTGGVALNHLVGAEFSVGPVVVRGVELGEPCARLAKLAGVPGLRKALVHRGGLRADVLVGGRLRVGDLIIPQGQRAP